MSTYSIPALGNAAEPLPATSPTKAPEVRDPSGRASSLFVVVCCLCGSVISVRHVAAHCSGESHGLCELCVPRQKRLWRTE
jgi:hypothetical protein